MPRDPTDLLASWSEGDTDALDELMPLVLSDLRRIARQCLGREKPITLQATELVHEMVVRLLGRREVSWKNSDQFLGTAAQLMRRLLIDRARRRKRPIHGAGRQKISIDEVPDRALADYDTDFEQLDDLLKDLARLDPRMSRIVELRYFVGLEGVEVAQHLGISLSTVKREWRTARLWLRREMLRGA